MIPVGGPVLGGRRTMRGRRVAVAAAAVAMLLAAGCGTTKQGGGGGSASGGTTAQKLQKIKAAWIYVGSPSDAGWTKAHDDGRKVVQATLGDRVTTTFKENVPEGPQAAQVIEDLVRDGNKIIFATSFGYQDAMAAAAAKHPDVYFEQATGSKLAPNLSEYFGAAEDADYLTGMAAGAASRNGRLGFVAPFPIPEVIREINAYTLGARTTHPGATVRVVWTNTWFDPGKEKHAAESLIATGVDVLGQGQDSPATGEAAKAASLKWCGYDSDQQSFAPDSWLTGTVYHWGPYYTREVRAAMDGTWKSHSYYGGLKDGFVDIAPFGRSVAQATRGAILARKQALVAGSFYEFQGPIKDQSGAVKVPQGTRLSLNDILTMDWFVQGVVGSPKGA
jgi:basic membrane protein A and related proteins